MPFYLTRDPVPSADMRNVFDNAQNLDPERYYILFLE
jgi:hypothetical protein